MAQQSLKNLDSFSRGYIEDVRSKVDFDTTLRARSTETVVNSTTITLTSQPVSVLDGSIPAELVNPIVGKVMSGTGIEGVPRVTDISDDRLTITFDQPQTFGDIDGLAITFSDTNSGIDQYELTGSAKSRSKEDIRIDQLIPEELLEYATNSAYGGNDTGGIRTFLESYYKFMNLEEFTYKDEEMFEDVVIDNQAAFRINVPNKFFQRNLVLAAKFFDADGLPLLVGNQDGTPIRSGDVLLLDDTSRLTVGESYQIVDIGNGTTENIATGINNITDRENEEYFLDDIFVATDVGTAYDATRGSTPVGVQLLVYPSVVDDIKEKNISISNANKLPGRLADSAEPTGRTVNIYGLSPRLNKRKITMKTFVYNYIDSGPSYRLNTIEDSLNLNEAQEEFLDLMQKEIAPSLDKTSPVNKRAIYEKIIDFYKIRGSFESIETFFKLLYNEQEVQVQYPWDNTLKPSAGLYDPKSAVQANYNETSVVESSNNENNDLFGKSVSVSGDSFAAGAPKEDSIGVNAGSVYVFTTTNKGQSYTEEQKISRTITDSDTNIHHDQFGRCVSLDGDTLAISAPIDETTAGVTKTGSVEVWNRSVNSSGNNVWNFTTKIVPPTGANGERFAFGNESVSLSGDYLAIGHEGFDADPDNFPKGAVALYKKAGTTYSLLQTIRAPGKLNSGRAGNIGFGTTVVLKGNYLVVSFENYSTSSVVKTGRVVVYKKDAISGLYVEDGILSPVEDVSNQTFGYAIDITNIENGTPRIALTSRDNPYHTVYIFDRDAVNIDNAVVTDSKSWHTIHSIPSYVVPSIRDNTNYGIIVRLSGDNLIIGEQGFDDGAITDNGKVYHYEYNVDTQLWDPKLQYRGDKTVVDANFGFALDLSDDDKGYLIIGAPGKPNGSGNQKGFVRTYTRPVLSGTFTTSSGFLSEKNIRVHDSDFYQKFSYVVKVGRNLSQWKEPFDKLVHPAGFKYFGEVLLVLQAVRNVLGDTNPNTSLGKGDDIEVYENSYSASPAFRKTLSSMPGVQPGYIGIEDIGLLIEAIASSFGIIGVARPNKNAKISMKTVSSTGGLSLISIPEPGHGYPSVPAITLGGDGSGATATAEINSKGEVNRVVLTGGHTTFDFSGIAADDARAAGTYTAVTTGGSRSSGSGASGQVTIVVTDGGSAATNGVISSITSTTTGSAYEVGEIITIPGSVMGGAAISFTVASVGTGYSVGGTTTAIQTIAQESADDGLTGDNEIVQFKIGKLNSTTLGLDLVGLNNKEHTSTPTIIISPPDARAHDGKPLSTNVQATATLTRNSTTGHITGYTITNPGNGYLNDATIRVETQTQKHVPNYIHKKIIPANHDDNITATLPENSYFARKDYDVKESSAFLRNKKFQGNYQINMFSNIAIEDINTTTDDGTTINKLNIQAHLSDAITETTL